MGPSAQLPCLSAVRMLSTESEVVAALMVALLCQVLLVASRGT